MKSLFDCLETRLERQFREFDRTNPHVWEKFVELALRAVDRGFTHYGAKTIVEIIRYHYDMRTTGERFRINNNFPAYYARKFHRLFPHLDGFFKTRRVLGSKDG